MVFVSINGGYAKIRQIWMGFVRQVSSDSMQCVQCVCVCVTRTRIMFTKLDFSEEIRPVKQSYIKICLKSDHVRRILTP